MIMKPLLLSTLFFLILQSSAIATILTISHDFSGDEKIDTISYSQTQDGIDIDYLIGASQQHRHYTQKNFDPCSAMGIYLIPNTKRIAIDGSCSSQGGQIYIHIYEWSKIHSDWCLVREITGEKPDVTSRDFIGSRHVSRVSGCPHIGDDGPYTYTPTKEVGAKIGQELHQLRYISKDPSKIERYIQTIPFYDPLEISDNLTKENVEDANNLAFYLSEKGRSHDALQLLKAIVQNFPDRVVARLNLADAYWNSELIESAKEMYASYTTEMRRLGKAKLIPSRAINRL